MELQLLSNAFARCHFLNLLFAYSRRLITISVPSYAIGDPQDE